MSKTYRHSKRFAVLSLALAVFLPCYIFMINSEHDIFFSPLTSSYTFKKNSYSISARDNVVDVPYSQPKHKFSITDEMLSQVKKSELFSDAYGVQNCTSMIETDGYNDYLKLLSMTDESLKYTWHYENTDLVDKLISRNISFSDYVSETLEELPDHNVLKKITDSEKDLVGLEIFSADEDHFSSHYNFTVLDGEINIDKLNSGEEIILSAPDELFFSHCNDGMFSSYGITDKSDLCHHEDHILKTAKLCYSVGDIINIKTVLSETEYTEKSVRIGAIVRSSNLDLIAVTTNSGFSLITGVTGGYSEAVAIAPGRVNGVTDIIYTSHLCNVFSDESFNVSSGFQKYKIQLPEIIYSAIILFLIALLVAMSLITANKVVRSSVCEYRMNPDLMPEKDFVHILIRQPLPMLAGGFLLGLCIHIGTFLFYRYYWHEELLKISLLPAIVIFAVVTILTALILNANIRKLRKPDVSKN